MSKARRGSLEPTIFAIVGIAILAGLGLWQLDRKVWKENLIAAMTERLAREPADLPARDRWAHLLQGREEFARVGFPAEFLPGQEALVYSAGSALRPDVQGPGYFVFAPARLAGGSIVLVNRGFVPAELKSPAARAVGEPHGPTTVTGLLRISEPHGGFLRANQPTAGRWYSRDVAAIARARGLANVAPYFIDADATPDNRDWPRGGLTVIHFRNSHLSYALTWFGLAFMVLVWAAWAALDRRLRTPASPRPDGRDR